MTPTLPTAAVLALALALAACSSEADTPDPTEDTGTEDTTPAEDAVDEPDAPEGITLTPGTPVCNSGTPYVASSPIGGELEVTVNDVASAGDFVAGHVVFAARMDFVACETVDFGDLFMFSIVAPEGGFAPGQRFDITASEATLKVDTASGFTTATGANGATGTLTLDAWDAEAGTFTVSGTVDGPELAPAHVEFTVTGTP